MTKMSADHPLNLAKKELTKLVREDPEFVYAAIGAGGIIEIAFISQATADKHSRQMGGDYKGFPVNWTTGEPFEAQ